MLLLLAVLLTFLLFDADITLRYAAATDVGAYQRYFVLALVAMSLGLLAACGAEKWLARKLRGTTDTPSRARHVVGAVAAFVYSTGAAAILYFATQKLLGRIFLEPIEASGATQPLALVREAALRLEAGTSAYATPMTLGPGWNVAFSVAPGLFRFLAWVFERGLDPRLVSVGAVGLTCAAVTWAGARALLRWGEGRVGALAWVAAGLSLGIIHFLSRGLCTQTFVDRMPTPLLWPVLAIGGLLLGGRGAGRLLAAAAVFGLLAGLWWPGLLFAPVVIAACGGARFCGGPGEASTRLPQRSGAALLFVGAFLGTLLPHWNELGAVALGTIREPHSAGEFLLTNGSLIDAPGLVHWLHACGLLALAPVAVMFLVAHLTHRTLTDSESAGGFSVVRRLALVALAIALAAPIPASVLWFPALILTAIAGLLLVAETPALEPVAAADSAPPPAPARAPASARYRLSLLTIAVALPLCAVGAGWKSFGNSGFDLAAKSKAVPKDSWIGFDWLKTGFHPAEGTQNWMNGQRAMLVLPMRHRRDGTLTLNLTVVGSATRPTNTLTLELNGRVLFTDRLATGTAKQLEVPVPKSAWLRGANTLVLRAGWADTPKAMMVGDDPRVLSFGFNGLRWKAGELKPTPPGQGK